jgi:hypothetical protein
MGRLLLALVGALSLGLLAEPAVAGRPLVVGAAEDAIKQPYLPAAIAKLSLARLAGLQAIRVTAQWTPGMRTFASGQRVELENAAAAAQLTGIRLYVAVYPRGSSVTPLTPSAQAEFAAYAASVAAGLRRYGVLDLIIGNEPNLNRFWMPQFGKNGSNTAAPAYSRLLARAYDAVKAVSPEARIIGGALAPRGTDRPDGNRPSHSPTTFIRDLGAAYRTSRRARPIMDAFAVHPYPDSAKQAPTVAHPRSTSISIADYDKLVSLLGKAFDGTAQKGRTLPILYAEFGVQSRIVPEKAALYTNHAAPAAADAVDESVQASYYRQAIDLASCQPNVTGLLLFLVSDEPDLRAWQSGLYYADDTPKSSLEPVRAAAEAAASEGLDECKPSEPGKGKGKWRSG